MEGLGNLREWDSFPPKEDEVEAFFCHVDAVLWPVFVYAAIRRAVSSSQYLYLGRSDFVKLMRSSRLHSSELDIIFQAEASQSRRKLLRYSGFKRCLVQVAIKQYRNQGPVDAFISFINAYFMSHTNKEEMPRHQRHPGFLHGAASLGCTELRAALNSSISDFFACFASPPTVYETQVLRRHRPRIDVDTARQSLSMEGWTHFCQVLKLHSRLSATSLAAIFIDVLPISAVDDLGGLNRDEFADAFFRLAFFLAPSVVAPKAKTRQRQRPERVRLTTPPLRPSPTTSLDRSSPPNTTPTTTRTRTARTKRLSSPFIVEATHSDEDKNTNFDEREENTSFQNNTAFIDECSSSRPYSASRATTTFANNDDATSFDDEEEEHIKAAREARRRCLAGLEFIRANLADITTPKALPSSSSHLSQSAFIAPPELDGIDLTGASTQRHNSRTALDSHLFLRAVASFHRVVDRHKFLL